MSEESIDQLRSAFEASQKENKTLLKRVDELAKENRTMKATQAVTDAGFRADVADLFIAANPEVDITVEAVKDFAERYNISGAAEVQDAETSSTPPPSGLANIARAGSRAGGSGQAPADTKYLTRDEFLKLQGSNPMEAHKALAEGRVRLREDNPYASGGVGSLNPFIRSASEA